MSRTSAAAITSQDLNNLWQNFRAAGLVRPIIEFYSHVTGAFVCFSNFYQHEPFTFTIPEFCGRALLEQAGRQSTVQIQYSEKAIMLCKASLMQDYQAYDQILAASSPRKAKSLGRLVTPWNEDKWQQNVCNIALAVVRRKFHSVPRLAETLLETGQSIIAEATSRDANWGIGINQGDPDAQHPRRWRGTNILGWALMEVREEMAGRPALVKYACAHKYADPLPTVEVKENPNMEIKENSMSARTTCSKPNDHFWFAPGQNVLMVRSRSEDDDCETGEINNTACYAGEKISGEDRPAAR